MKVGLLSAAIILRKHRFLMEEKYLFHKIICPEEGHVFLLEMYDAAATTEERSDSIHQVC